MFSRHTGCVEHALELWDICPEDSHAQREGNRREKEQILCSSVKGRGVLKDAQASGADCQDCEPLPVNGEVSIINFVARNGVKKEGWRDRKRRS